MQANLESSSAGTAPSASEAVTDLAGNVQSTDGDTGSIVAGDEASTDWEALMQEDEAPIAPVVAPVVEAKPAAEKTATELALEAAAKPAVEQPVAGIKPVAEVAAPAAQAAVVAPVVETKPVATVQKTAAEVEAERVEFDKQEATRFEGLVKSYALPEDMAVKLSTEPENVLPYLAARVHQSVAKAMAVAMEQMIPQFFHSYSQVTQAESTARNAFETRWPELKGMDKEVLEVGAMFRRLNPTASAQEAIEKIGAIVAQAKGLQVVGKPAAAGSTPAARPAVFKPSGGGTSASSAASPASEQNEFSKLAEEFLTDDKG